VCAGITGREDTKHGRGSWVHSRGVTVWCVCESALGTRYDVVMVHQLPKPCGGHNHLPACASDTQQSSRAILARHLYTASTHHSDTHHGRDGVTRLQGGGRRPAHPHHRTAPVRTVLTTAATSRPPTQPECRRPRGGQLSQSPAAPCHAYAATQLARIQPPAAFPTLPPRTDAFG
jgi:hypothetical protein